VWGPGRGSFSLGLFLHFSAIYSVRVVAVAVARIVCRDFASAAAVVVGIGIAGVVVVAERVSGCSLEVRCVRAIGGEERREIRERLHVYVSKDSFKS
jgi:hypothetical protein